ncbi:MAG: nuclear transport factor 2 family protein [Bacteroidota bacterium]
MEQQLKYQNSTKSDTIIIDLERLKKDTWTEQEYENARLIIDFVQNLMNNHDFAYIKQTYGNHPYTQHNQTMVDGLKGVLGVVSGFAKRYPDYTYDVKHVYVDGPFVTLHSHATIDKKHRGNPQKGLNIMDIWKVEDGIIHEHWDAVQPINGSMRFLFWMSGGKFKNDNTYF